MRESEFKEFRLRTTYDYIKLGWFTNRPSQPRVQFYRGQSPFSYCSRSKPVINFHEGFEPSPPASTTAWI